MSLRLNINQRDVAWIILVTIVIQMFVACAPKTVITTDDEEQLLVGTEKSPVVVDPEEQSVVIRVDDIIERGENIPFDVCSPSPDWVRPSADKQASIWNSIRYSGADEDILKYPWTHDFLVTYGHTSVDYGISDLAGLWSLPDGARSVCFKTDLHDAVLKLQKAKVWVLLHEVKEIMRLETSYAIIVEPNEQGVQFVHFPRFSQSDPLNLYFVTQEGRVIDSIIEADYMYWPYPQLIPAVETDSQ